jgi:large subunit ribosomal protein L1
MPNGKRYRADFEKHDISEVLPLDKAVDRLKTFKPTKFDQTVEIAMHLAIDARQADQAIRGSIALPHGVGQSRRVVAFCTDDKIEAAKAAGAVEAGGAELVKKISDGWMEFDVAVASPDMMKVASKLGRVLGPKGLMPSPKAGTVTPDVVNAVTEYSAGKVEYRNDSGGNIHAPVGKLSFDAQKLFENASTFIDHITKLKPASSKGHYIKRISLSGTMTPGILVAEDSVAK